MIDKEKWNERVDDLNDADGKLIEYLNYDYTNDILTINEFNLPIVSKRNLIILRDFLNRLKIEV